VSQGSPTPDLAGLTRELVEAGGGEATMRFFAPTAVYDLSVLGAGVFEGYAAIRDFFAAWESSYEEEEDEAQEIIEFGNGVVLAIINGKARPAGSPADVQVTARRNAVVVWAHGLVERVIIYRDTDEAHAAAKRLAAERD
jgi:hypothetical protein